MSFTPGTRGLGDLEGDFSCSIAPLGVVLTEARCGAYWASYCEDGSGTDLGIFLPYVCYPLTALEEREGIVLDGDWAANYAMLFENGYPVCSSSAAYPVRTGSLGNPQYQARPSDAVGTRNILQRTALWERASHKSIENRRTRPTNERQKVLRRLWARYRDTTTKLLGRDTLN